MYVTSWSCHRQTTMLISCRTVKDTQLHTKQVFAKSWAADLHTRQKKIEASMHGVRQGHFWLHPCQCHGAIPVFLPAPVRMGRAHVPEPKVSSQPYCCSIPCSAGPQGATYLIARRLTDKSGIQPQVRSILRTRPSSLVQLCTMTTGQCSGFLKGASDQAIDTLAP
jgi:hypothetical protein